VYDNGGTTADRYTVAVIRTEKGIPRVDVYTMSRGQGSPDCVNQYSHTQTIYVGTVGYYLRELRGKMKREQVHNLPEDVIRAIEERVWPNKYGNEPR
jgi:hypothetical protein